MKNYLRLNLLLLAGDFGDSAAQLQGDFRDGRQHVTLCLARRHAWGSSRHLDLQGGSLGVLLPRPLPLLVLLLVLLVLLVITPTSLPLLNIAINNMFDLYVFIKLQINCVTHLPTKCLHTFSLLTSLPSSLSRFSFLSFLSFFSFFSFLCLCFSFLCSFSPEEGCCRLVCCKLGSTKLAGWLPAGRL